MALPLIAEVPQLIELMGPRWPDGQESRAEGVLRAASNLARGEAGKSWVIDGASIAPEEAVDIVLGVADRAMDNPDGITSETYPEYVWRRDTGEANEFGVYLTDDETKRLRRLGGKSGLWTQPTTRLDRCGDTVFVDDQYGCDPFPLYDANDVCL